MISIVVDANIVFSALYNKEGLERTILNTIIETDSIQLFAPDIFNEEISRNLELKLGYSKDEIERYLSEFNVIEVPSEKYILRFPDSKRLSVRENDIPYIATALLLNAPIWSGNEKHFKRLELSTEIIWFNSRRLLNYLRSKNVLE